MTPASPAMLAIHMVDRSPSVVPSAPPSSAPMGRSP
jgi:hypothetical protein